MKDRAAITLIEVLVAIFVAAIGTLSLLVLFPLGALNMARALRDDRCAQAAASAGAIADAGIYAPPPANVIYPFRSDPNVTPVLTAGNPVYIDAMAVNVMGSSAGVGGLGGTAPTTSISRVTPSTVVTSLGATAPTPLYVNATNYMTYRLFRLPDDLSYNALGAADTSAGYVNRGGRYSWAYMVRPSPSITVPVGDMAIVVYDGRNIATAGGESCYLPAQPSTGTTYPIGSTSITIQYSGSPLPISGSAFYATTSPPLRRGSWILDVSNSDTSSPASDSADIGNIHSFFYRVVDVNDNGSGLVQLDLETPLVAAINGANVTTPKIPGIIVVLENVAQVYERRTGWQP
jgi:hypothetical protein